MPRTIHRDYTPAGWPRTKALIFTADAAHAACDARRAITEGRPRAAAFFLYSAANDRRRARLVLCPQLPTLAEIATDQLNIHFNASIPRVHGTRPPWWPPDPPQELRSGRMTWFEAPRDAPTSPMQINHER